MKRKILLITIMTFSITLLLSGCMRPGPTTTPVPTEPPARVSSETETTSTPAPAATQGSGQKPSMPGKFTEGEEPTLKVYVADKKTIEDMTIEKYLEGVLAGEMKNDWPIEALKAQAILARTFALQFIEEKGGSRFEGADVSTDITEAQAYDASGINDAIRRAINETRGLVLGHNGELIRAWFHAHSGGLTAYAKEGLGFEGDEPPYIHSVKSQESEKAPQDAAQWEESFTMEEIKKACADIGVTINAIDSVKVGKTGKSGRAETLIIGGKEVMAPGFRVALDSMRMRSTLLTSFRIENGKVVIAGKGYGHGVGMSQWGAYGMADNGKTAEEIVKSYFKDVEVYQMWQ